MNIHSIDSKSILFSPLKLGPISIRNRSIRAAAFEGMSPNHTVSQALIDYHQSVAKGGIGMTTLAYTAIDKSGLSFPHQLYMHASILPDLKKLSNAVHRENAAISVQLGHAGNMAKASVTGTTPISASSHINWYGPTFARSATIAQIKEIVTSCRKAAAMAYDAGFDAIEIHAGHGYLLSQFLSPDINQRNDEYGGPLINRMRLLKEVLQQILDQVGNKMAILVKLNMEDGYEKGLNKQEALQVAIELQSIGVHALILSAGFVSKAPMYIMKGSMPLDILAQGMQFPENLLVKLFGKQMIPSEPFTPLFFLQDAIEFRNKLHIPLIYIGGVLSAETVEEVLNRGFDGVAIARALIAEPDFINKIHQNNKHVSPCNSCNQCVASIYNGKMTCPFTS